MGRAPCCSKVGLHRGPWTTSEDTLLIKYIQCQGEGNWRSLPKEAGLLRCGKSCRLRWMNYLRPDIKRGNIEPDEEDLIIRLHSLLGNRWSLIAGRLPGRTDNEIKNYWNSHLSKRIKTQGHQCKEGISKATFKFAPEPQKKNNINTDDVDSNSKTDNSKKNKKRKKNEIKEIEKSTRIKIHIPKPTRFTSFMRDSNSMERSSNSNSTIESTSTISEGTKSDTTMKNMDIIPWSDAMQGDLLFAENDPNHALAWDFPTEGCLLESLYDEYSQLLNAEEGYFHLNPFADSLLV